MRSWSISEARSKIADLFEAALSEGPQKIERREQDAVVVISASAWRTIENEYADFADLILSAPLEDDDLPTRRPARVIDGD